MYTPASALLINSKELEKAIQELDESFKEFHGWHPWEEGFSSEIHNIDEARMVAKKYVAAGWSYVYFGWSSDEHPSMMFRMSKTKLDSNVVNRMTMVTKSDLEISVGDMVKVIAPTMFNEKLTEAIPIGTICRVTEVRKIKDEILVTIISLENSDEFCYLAPELERGYIEWHSYEP